MWAILVDPEVRWLVDLAPDPRSVISALADELAAAFLDTVAGLLGLAPALHDMPLATGLSLSLQKCVVLNFSALSHCHLQRALLDEAGLAFRLDGDATYLDVVIGLDAEPNFGAKACTKYLPGEGHVRAIAGPARERLVAYMMFASSVLHYLAQVMPVPMDLQRAGAAAVASLLAAPMWVFSPDALTAILHRALRLTFRALPLVAGASPLRLA